MVRARSRTGAATLRRCAWRDERHAAHAPTAFRSCGAVCWAAARRAPDRPLLRVCPRRCGGFRPCRHGARWRRHRCGAAICRGRQPGQTRCRALTGLQTGDGRYRRLEKSADRCKIDGKCQALAMRWCAASSRRFARATPRSKRHLIRINDRSRPGWLKCLCNWRIRARRSLRRRSALLKGCGPFRRQKKTKEAK